MPTLNLEVKLLSSALVGSGGGFGSIIDTDVVFDQIGLPYLPAKRIKGCLRDAAEEVLDMFNVAGIATDKKLQDGLPTIFGSIGSAQTTGTHFSDLLLKEYAINRQWLEYYTMAEHYSEFISRETVIQFFTEIRQQTRIDADGTAADHSLRTIRVLREGFTFSGTIQLESDDPAIVQLLQLACLNWKRFGTNRNRGYGAMQCSLDKPDGPLEPVEDILGALCTA